MESYKKKITDAELKGFAGHVERNTLNTPIVFETVPAKDMVQVNTIGTHGTDIYIRCANGKLLKLTGVEIT